MTLGFGAGPATTRPHLRERALWSVGLFVALAVVLAWLVALPLWLGDGLATPWFPVVAIAMMMTPTIAALAVVLFVEPSPHKAATLGLWPLRPVRRLIGYAALGIVVSIVLVLAALPVGALFGVYPADFVHFSAFQQTLDENSGGAELPLPIGALVAIQLITLPVASLINLIPALGEELGWRGWLLPKLMPLGTLWALLISGIIWGLWHAPLILLGYNYPSAPGWLGVTAMVIMCILVGAVFSWLRLRSGSIWPPALAHAAFNGAGGSHLLFARAGEHIDTTQATILGWSGWIVPLALVVLLAATGQFTPRDGRPTGTDEQEAVTRGVAT
ncbi:CPBP family intramembrane glutamic endopeptidase [Brachybacterium sp.]|uniref:CPBP family intramembrane glutamic endopeptidase n=1 Tax=Brachybacterium sp. TaxID=1891286 RepID=UPI002ED37E20